MDFSELNRWVEEGVFVFRVILGGEDAAVGIGETGLLIGVVVRGEDYAVFTEVGEEGWGQWYEARFGRYASVSVYSREHYK